MRLRDLLLLIPIAAMVMPGLYARQGPEFLGMPFFYWYQFAWVVGGALVTGILFWLHKRDERSK